VISARSELPVQVGFTVQSRHLRRGVSALRAHLDAMEDAGIDFASVLDHLTFWDGTGFDALTNAAAVAAAHDRMPVVTTVVVLPVRHPVVVARQVSTLCELAPGRLTLGVGIGGEDRHEIAAAGIDPRTRGRRMDESMAIVRALVAGERVTCAGEFYELDDVCVRPAPVQPVPMLVGGRSDAALRRAAHLGDGWLGFACSPERFGQARKVVEHEAELGRRAIDPLDFGIVIWCGFGRGARDAREVLAAEIEDLYKIPFERFERYCPHGSPAEVADQLGAWAAQGCRRFSVISTGATVDDELAGVAAVREVLVREFG